jgi:hypothetical protein
VSAALHAAGVDSEPSIESILVNRLAFLPEAGRPLAIPAVRLRLDSSEIVDAETTSWTLTHRGRPLPRTGDGWLIPSELRKKRLLLTVTATYRGANRTVALPVTPR